MCEAVSVDDAISKGHRMITVPISLIILIGIFLGLFLAINKIVPYWFAPLSIIIAILPAWLYWSFFITKWRIWAFENVRNVHELKKRAIREKLIWKDGSFFEKTEFRNQNQKDTWEKLLVKFDKADVFVDDPSIPETTLIYYSKFNVYTQVGMGFVVMMIGIGNLINNQSPTLGIIMIAISIYFLFKSFKKAKNREPQLILNEKGIETSEFGFHEWSQIYDEEVCTEGSGKSIKRKLVYSCQIGQIEFYIDDLTTDIKSLNKLLIIYRGRNLSKK
jgi:hypothetical protein